MAKRRTLHLTNPLLTGPDVRAAQELLHAHGFDPGLVDGVYGPTSAAATHRAKFTLGYPLRQVDGAFGPKLHDLLAGTAKPSPAWAKTARARHAAGQHGRQHGQPTLRERIVANGRWGIHNEPLIHYQQSRPIDGLHVPRKLPLHTDCSGFVTDCYAWAGASDPNGLNYNGQGYTGTLLRHLTQIGIAGAEPGDLVVWGEWPGHHVAMLLEPGPDPLLVSHGQERGPLAIRFAEESAYQRAPATWLRGVR